MILFENIPIILWKILNMEDMEKKFVKIISKDEIKKILIFQK